MCVSHRQALAYLARAYVVKGKEMHLPSSIDPRINPQAGNLRGGHGKCQI